MIVPDIAGERNGGGSMGAISQRTVPPVPARLDKRKWLDSAVALKYSIEMLYSPLPRIGFPRKKQPSIFGNSAAWESFKPR
jgi:hypothetical protein